MNYFSKYIKKIQKFILLANLSLLLFQSLFGQANETKELKIQKIRNNFQTIQQERMGYDLKVIKGNCMISLITTCTTDTEGNVVLPDDRTEECIGDVPYEEVYYYYKNKEIQLIVFHSVLFGCIHKKTEYYFEHNELSFVFQLDFTSPTIYSENQCNLSETRYYLSNYEAIKVLQKSISCEDAEDKAKLRKQIDLQNNESATVQELELAYMVSDAKFYIEISSKAKAIKNKPVFDIP